MGHETIINQLAILSILIVIGVAFAKAGVITENVKEAMSRIIIDVTLPFLILSTFIKIDLNPDLLRNSLLVFVLTFSNLGLLYLMGHLSSKIQRLNPADTTVHLLHTMFGNIVFLGFPVLNALFPNGTGILYGAIYQLASNTITFTYGIYRLSAGTQKSGIKSLLNLNTAALTLGIIVMLTGIKLPTQVVQAFSGIGQCTSPMSMIYIGALLAGMNFKASFKMPSVYALSLNKLIIAPVVLGFIYYGLMRALGINYSVEALMVVVLQAAMPCQTIVVVLTKRYEGSFALATSNLFITTLLSVATLPLVYTFLVWLMGGNVGM